MTHTCQICGRDNLNLVLEGHLAPEPINAKACIPPCPGSGTDRYVREEEFQTKLKEVKTSVTSQPLNRESVTSKGDADVQAEGVSSKSTLEVSEKERIKWRARAISNESTLAAEQARSRALHEALETLLRYFHTPLNYNRPAIEARIKAKEALAAYATAAPLPPDAAGDGELLDLFDKCGLIYEWAVESRDGKRWHSVHRVSSCKLLSDERRALPWHDSFRDAIRAAIVAEKGRE